MLVIQIVAGPINFGLAKYDGIVRMMLTKISTLENHKENARNVKSSKKIYRRAFSCLETTV